MKTYKFDDIVGRTITGVTIKESSDGRPPKHQVFFEFEDGSYFELFSESAMSPANLGAGGREAVERYMAPQQKVVFQTTAHTGS